MIDWLLSVLIGAWVPGLEDPSIAYRSEMNTLVNRLQKSSTLVETPASDPSDSSSDFRAQPNVTGRLFERRSLSELTTQVGLSADVISALSLTGLVQSGKERFAIVNDGEADHVVAAGSYLLRGARVLSVNQGSVLLSVEVNEGESKVVELRLESSPEEETKP
ncbi:MAG TPA: hypothetical protein VFV43_10435 [Limnobacter sp.]|nr:hypothetical protein [Limnobacter sp.]